MYILSNPELVIAKKVFTHENLIEKNDLVNALGIYPEEVLDLVETMKKNNLIIEIDNALSLTGPGKAAIAEYPFAKKLIVDTTNVGNKYTAVINGMVQEHPLQFQYWFDKATCESIVNAFTDEVFFPKPRLAFLGTPLLALYFNMVFPDYSILVVDISVCVLNYLKVFVNENVKFLIADMRQDDVNITDKFDVVFMDPPFYADYYEGFLKWASSLQNEDGLLFTVLFGSNIKGNNAERKIVTDLISKDYTIIRLHDGILNYLVPAFEKNTYKSRTNNSLNILDWRHNALGIFSKCVINSSQKILYAKEYDWTEYVFSRKRIFVRKNISKLENTFLFRPLYDDSNILKSVSRRNFEREQIGLWTSKNEVYTASDSALEVLHVFLANIKNFGSITREKIHQYEEKYGKNNIRKMLQTLYSLIEEGKNE